MHGRHATIFGGICLIILDVYGISEGRLPLKGAGALDLVEHPQLFWSYSIALGAIGAVGIFLGACSPGLAGWNASAAD